MPSETSAATAAFKASLRGLPTDILTRVDEKSALLLYNGYK